MADTFTTPHRLAKLETGAYIDTWGTEYGEMLDLVADALDGRQAFTLSGSKTLSENNGADDENRARFLDVTGGTGGTITTNGDTKFYLVRNGSTGLVTVTTGSGNTAKFLPKETGICFCDGTDFERLGGYNEYALISSAGPGSSTAYTYTDGLLDDYSEIIIVLAGLSHDNGSPQNFRVSLDGSGATHTYFATLKSSVAGTSTLWGQLVISRPRRNSDNTCYMHGAVEDSTANAWEPNTTDVIQAGYFTGPAVLGSLKFDFGGTANFDAGIIYIYGRG